MSALPPIRPDLSLTEGYHSPQVEAEVRLNTNESPFPPPEAWSRDLLAALAEVSFHRYPDRPATELPRRGGRVARRHARGGVLRQRLQRGAAVPAAGVWRPRPKSGRLRADVCAALAHQPADRDHGGRGRPHRGLPHRPRDGADAPGPHAARHHLLVLAQQPDGPGRAAGDRRRNS